MAGQLLRPTHPLRPEAIADQLADVSEQLAEFDYLFEDLTRRSAELEAHGLMPPAFAEKLSNLENFYLRSSDVSQRAAYLQAKTLIRECYRELGFILCSGDWQSPVYAASTNFAINRLHEGIAEHQLDYKRDGHLEAAAYEQNFIDEYVSHLNGKQQTKAYLTNSGMAAFSTVLHWLAHEQRLTGPTVAVEPMYFENLHLAGGFFPELLPLQSPSTENLLEQLRLNQPSMVLVDALTNCNDVLAHDIETILRWASHETTETTAIVVDTTCVPTALLPVGLLSDVPENVIVVLVESLAKHHQFGMDAVTGGVVILSAKQHFHASFSKTRARFGGNITDVAAATLPQPNGNQLKARMYRHSRNSRLLIERIQEKIQGHFGIINSFSWLSDPASFAPDFHGSCFTIHLQEDLKSIDKYRQFEQQVLQRARQQNLPLALSTSFGFDVTRLYVTAPSTAFEPPFLRVAVGTETVQEIESLAEIIASVHRQLALIWKPRNPAREPMRHQPAPVRWIPSASPDRALQKHNVFSGENAIKEYLSPAYYQKTPLVELPADLNPYLSKGVHIFAKIMPLVPLMNIKSIPAYSMLAAAAARGDLNGVQTIIESSSGNTVLSLSVIARLFGINETRAIVDHSIAPALVRMLRLFGVEIMMHPGPGHELYDRVQRRSERARQLGAQDGWLNPGQYSNQDNPDGFAKWLAPDLWAQTKGQMDLFSGALGTCGTIYGISTELKKRNPLLEVIACCPISGQAVPGPREASQLVDVAFPWEDVVNARLELGAQESFAASVKLLRRGIMGGPSSGMNYAGLLSHIGALEESGRLHQMLQQNKGEMNCVFLCCDSPLAHVDEYFDALSEEHFSAVHEFSVEAQ